MQAYILRRIIGTIPVLLLASVVIFLIIHLIPGDPIYNLLPPDPRPEQIEAVRQQYGFDRPLYEQYFKWLGNALRGNWGTSIANGWQVSKLLRMKVWVTFQLAVAAFIVAIIISVPLGLRAGLKPDGFLARRFLNFYTAFGFAIPSFWLGIMLILFFGVFLRLLPTSGFKSFFDDPGRALKYLILPAFTQGLPGSVIYSNFISNSVQEIRQKEYVIAAIAKGLPSRVVIFKHILKNALIPVVTVAAITFGRLMAGAVITESVFGIPGLGRLLVESISARDYAVLQADLLLIVLIFIFANFVADLLYAWLDPRIRFD